MSGIINLEFKELLLPPIKYVAFVDYMGPMKGPHAHRHYQYQMLIVLEGEFYFIADSGERITLSTGEASITKPGLLHTWHAPDNVKCKTFMVFFDPISVAQLGEVGNVFTNSTDMNNWKVDVDLNEVLPALNRIRSECIECSSMANTMVFAMTISIITDIAKRIIRKYGIKFKTEHPQPLMNAINYIEKNHSANFSLNDLALHCCLSVSRLSELFRIHLGTSPFKYVNAYRIKKAKILLRYTSLSVSEVASQVGFQSVFYFSRNFTKIIKTSPSKYKASSKN